MDESSVEARRVHARHVLTTHPARSVEVGELCRYRYALVERAQFDAMPWVTGHDSVREALVYFGGEVRNGWRPVELVDLDTGEVVASEARDDFNIEVVVTTGSTEQRRAAAEHELVELRRGCHYDDDGGIDEDGNDLSSYDAYIDYKNQLEDLCLELLTAVLPGVPAAPDADAAPDAPARTA